MSTTQFDGVVRAAMKGEGALWEIGDEIIKVTGPALAAHGKNDGNRKKLKEISVELEKHGLGKYKAKTLAEIRTTAIVFQGSKRVPGIAFSVHTKARTPERLFAAIDAAAAMGREIVSERFVREIERNKKAEDRAARKEAYNDAVAAKKEAEFELDRAREDKRTSNSKEAREAAVQREQEAREMVKEATLLAKQLKSAPLVKHSSTKKDPAETPGIVVQTAFSADIQKAKALAEKMSQDIEHHIDDLSDAFVASAVEDLLAVADAFRQLSNKIRSGRINKRSHLYAVGE